ncbi:hypothetical protein [Clostridium cellulovorans]|uniref:Uncharacterized protein n=1 Tax=Clostridium cellulovorans (strain ATCC 35296 / DSM 3052 / OCM 3 / 743B) TaxID=573061 RepID=D9SS31_CLOC7|nr:hypothetical protein [Clostridium cellulovorans]ADL52478.1 hypothetical protein Clocel_2781 [Clostridium cellulovorans 743B]
MKKYGLLSMVGTAVVASTLTYLYIENESNKDNHISGGNSKTNNNSQKTTYGVTTIKTPAMNDKTTSSTISNTTSTTSTNKTSSTPTWDTDDDLDAFKVHRAFDFLT